MMVPICMLMFFDGLRLPILLACGLQRSQTPLLTAEPRAVATGPSVS